MYRTGRKQRKVRPQLAPFVAAEEPPVAAAQAPPPSVAVRAPATSAEAKPIVIKPATNACVGLHGAIKGVKFFTDSAKLTERSMDILDELAYKLGRCDDRQLEISAHTDSQGTEEYNQALSEKRVRTVVRYLIANGLSQNRVKATAFGEARPIDTNDTIDGRAINRRVDLHVK